MRQPAIFHREALETVRSFPARVRRELGKAIFDLQKGETLRMPVSRPMPEIGAGVEEIRIRDRGGSYRAFYLARLEGGILIFMHSRRKHKRRQSADLLWAGSD
jgi:phage-related protein